MCIHYIYVYPYIYANKTEDKNKTINIFGCKQIMTHSLFSYPNFIKVPDYLYYKDSESWNSHKHKSICPYG